MTIKAKLNSLDLYELTEVLLAVKYQCGLDTELEARQNIEAGKYSTKEIFDAIAYYRTKGLGSHKTRMAYLPQSLELVLEDYSDKL